MRPPRIIIPPNSASSVLVSSSSVTIGLSNGTLQRGTLPFQCGKTAIRHLASFGPTIFCADDTTLWRFHLDSPKRSAVPLAGIIDMCCRSGSEAIVVTDYCSLHRVHWSKEGNTVRHDKIWRPTPLTCCAASTTLIATGDSDGRSISRAQPLPPGLISGPPPPYRHHCAIRPRSSARPRLLVKLATRRPTFEHRRRDKIYCFQLPDEVSPPFRLCPRPCFCLRHLFRPRFFLRRRPAAMPEYAGSTMKSPVNSGSAGDSQPPPTSPTTFCIRPFIQGYSQPGSAPAIVRS